jgi:ABC-2 type transport system permease protein
MAFFLRSILLAARQQTTYRTALWAGLATNLFFGILRVAVVVALYGLQPEVNGLPLDRAITFVGLSQAMIAFLTLFGNYDLLRTVANGSIAADLLRPFSFFLTWMARDWGRSLVQLVGRGLLFMAFFALLFPVYVPSGDPARWVWFSLSLLLSWLVSFAWRFLVNLAAFWTPDATGVARGAFALAQLFSGFIYPLRMLPDWFAALCAFTPFPAMVNTPLEIYLGTLTGAALHSAILQQAGWALGLCALSQWVYGAGIRKLVIQGG